MPVNWSPVWAGWIPEWKGVSIVSRSTAFWGGRYAFEAFRVRRPAEFPEPRFECEWQFNGLPT
jgi:hypothetical protein